MKIASIDEPRPRRTIMGKQVSGFPLSDAEHYFRCKFCGR
jgi:hypothetical protein